MPRRNPAVLGVNRVRRDAPAKRRQMLERVAPLKAVERIAMCERRNRSTTAISAVYWSEPGRTVSAGMELYCVHRYPPLQQRCHANTDSLYVTNNRYVSQEQPGKKFRRHPLRLGSRASFSPNGAMPRLRPEEVARRARVTRGALYHHFRDKQDLFKAVLHEKQMKLAASIFGAQADNAHQACLLRRRQPLVLKL